MKRCVFIAFFVIHSLFCIAKPISKAESLKIAQQFYQKQCVPQGTNLKSATNLDFKLDFICSDANPKLKSGSISSTPMDSIVYYYIYNVGYNKGFVIVSGDDRTTNIFGYSSEGKFVQDNIPENVKTLMDNYKYQVKVVIQNNVNALVQKSAADDKDSIAVSPLIKTKWGQDAPYNSNIPITALTGCVATSMAQVMNYHKWPVTGKSSYSYNYNGNTYSANFGTTSYDWMNMLDEYSKSEDVLSVNSKAVATLMYHCGVSVNMQYTTGSSGASSQDIPASLINSFGYDKDVRYINSETYTPGQFKYQIMLEIKAARPVIIAGHNDQFGHSYIADGYDSYNFIHFNWGWDGDYNGYFEIDQIDASTYWIPHGIIIGIQKPVSTSEVALFYQGFNLENGLSVSKTQPLSTTIKVSEENNKSFTGEIGIAFYKNGALYEIINTASSTITSGSSLTKSYSISKLDTLTSGTYRLVPLFKSVNDTVWSEIKYKNTTLTTDTRTNENIEFVVSSSGLVIYQNSKTMDCKKGDFRTKFLYADWESVKRLVVSGDIDQWDMMYMAGAKSIKIIDINDANILETKIDNSNLEYGGKPGNFNEFYESLSSTWKNFEDNFWHGIKNEMFKFKGEYIGDGKFVYQGMVYDDLSGDYNIYVPEKPEYTDSQINVQISGHQGLLWEIGEKGIMADALSNSTIENITLPDNLKYIAPMVFANCPNLKTIVLPDSIALIGDSLFYNCPNLKEIQFPNSLDAIWSQGFSSLKNIEKITLPNSLDSIANNSFTGCTKLTSINMPENLVKIGQGAFSGCNSLTTMTIPLSVDTIQSEAFLNCSGLTAIYAHATTPVNLDSSPNVFFSSNKSASTCKLYVPDGSKSAYQNASQWKDFYNIIEMPGFTLLPTAANIAESSGSYPDLVNVSISSAWTAYSNQYWLKIVKESGTGNGKIALKASTNPMINPRTATITVSAFGFASQSITITQAAGAASLSVSLNEISIPNAADSIRAVDVISNTDWTANSDQSWLKVTPASGSGLKRLTFISTDMPSTISRTAKVTVSSSGLNSQIITVTQAIGAAKLAVSSNEISISNVSESTQTADIISNTKWTASSNQIWLTINTSSGSGSGKLDFKVNAMPTITTRTAKLTISSPGLTAQIIIVTQSAGEASFKLTTSASGAFTFGTTANKATSVHVDWGDGLLIAESVGTYWTEMKSANNLKAGTIVSIYGQDVVGLDLMEKNLTSIDVTNLKSLWMLYCYGNKLTTLDLSKNTELIILSCPDNNLNSLDVRQNAKLTSLVCWNNQLMTLDVSSNAKLEIIDCSYNQLTALDLSKNIVLRELNCELNSIPFSQLPQSKLQYTKYVYSPQSDFLIQKTIEKGILIDLSNQLNAKDVNGTIQSTNYKWKTTIGNTLIEEADYKVSEPGKFVFITIPSALVYCEMSNAAFPDFKDKDIYKTSNAEIITNPLPAAAEVITGTATVCQGQRDVNYSVPAIVNTTSYVWTLPSGATGTSTTNSITVNYVASAFSGNITVVGKNAYGIGIASTRAIVVNPLPATAGVITGTATVCQGQSAVVYTLLAIENATSYIWTLPTGATGTSTTNTITVNYGITAVSGNIIVKGKNACGEGAASALAIVVNPLPATAGVITGTATVCQGQSEVVYTVPAIANVTSYSWTLPTGATGTSTTNTITVNYGTSAVSDNITVKGENECGEGIASILAIVVNPLPSNAEIITGLATVCQGQNAIVYTVPAIANATSYVWTLPTGTAGTSTTNSINVNYGALAVSGNITVKGKNECGDGTASTLAIVVNPLPAKPAITINGNTLHSDAIIGNQWYNQIGAINDATNQDYIAPESNNYTVMVSLLGCSSVSSNTINFVITGIDASEKNQTIKVYPNPVSNELHLENNGNIDEIKFVIVNSRGQIVYKSSFYEKAIVPTSSFATGMYLIKFNLGNTFEIRKVIKN